MKLKVGSTYKDGRGRLVLITHKDDPSGLSIANDIRSLFGMCNYFGQVIHPKPGQYEYAIKHEYRQDGRLAEYKESINDLKEEIVNPDQPATELGKTLYL